MKLRAEILLSAVVITLISLLFLFFLGGYDDLLHLLALGLFQCFVFYQIIRFITDRYVLKKVLPIYNRIFGMNSTARNEEEPLSDPVLEAEKSVAYWAEDRLRQIQDLQKRDDFRKEFIGNLAHELKTPLFTVQGYVNSLLEGALHDESVNEKFLKKASKNIDRMTRIVEDLDSISQLESERSEIDISRMDLARCAREVLDSLEKKAEHKKVKLELATKDPVYVLGDEFRIGQVFTNLVNNSISYGNEGGNVKILFTDIKDRILVEVIDDGPGIDADNLARVFERFYRLDKSRSRNVGGSGLGLAIVKHIIDAHGQKVDAKSKPGEGSTFFFTLNKSKD